LTKISNSSSPETRTPSYQPVQGFTADAVKVKRLGKLPRAPPAVKVLGKLPRAFESPFTANPAELTLRAFSVYLGR
jgi:hypothetical protein